MTRSFLPASSFHVLSFLTISRAASRASRLLPSANRAVARSCSASRSPGSASTLACASETLPAPPCSMKSSWALRASSSPNFWFSAQSPSADLASCLATSALPSLSAHIASPTLALTASPSSLASCDRTPLKALAASATTSLDTPSPLSLPMCSVMMALKSGLGSSPSAAAGPPSPSPLPSAAALLASRPSIILT